MIDIIAKAAENLYTDQLGLPYIISDTSSQMRTVVASIDIMEGGTASHRVFLTYSRGVLKQIAELMLGETVDDDATLTDMALETANLIVGSAKVLAAEQDIDFHISTPLLQDDHLGDEELQAMRLFTFDDQEMMIAIKGLLTHE